MFGDSKNTTSSKKSSATPSPWRNTSSPIPTSGTRRAEPKKSAPSPWRNTPSPIPTGSTRKAEPKKSADVSRKPGSNNGAPLKPAPQVSPAPASRAKDLRARHLLNKPPPMAQQQSPASASTPEEQDPPQTTPPELCKDPQAHPGSSTLLQSPVNSFFVQQSWYKGPSDPSGTIVALSDRPSLCMSVSGWELAVGSSDHAVYTIDLQTCGVTRIMHGKSYGHTEWVTCLDHLQDGRIISGGMDNKLCLWEKRGVRSRDLKGHTASISGVKAGCFNQGTVAVSSSYDRSLILWDLGGATGRELGKLAAHKAPVLEFATTPAGRLVSGCRDGTVILWDVNTRSPVLNCRNAHKGHVTAMKCLEEESGELFLSGGQDGLLQVWDFRCSKPVHFVSLHRSTKGVGALTGIAVSKKTGCGCPLITTAGADRVLKVLDVRASFNVIHTLEDHRDFIYTLDQARSCGVALEMDRFSSTMSSGGNASTAWEQPKTGQSEGYRLPVKPRRSW